MPGGSVAQQIAVALGHDAQVKLRVFSTNGVSDDGFGIDARRSVMLVEGPRGVALVGRSRALPQREHRSGAARSWLACGHFRGCGVVCRMGEGGFAMPPACVSK